MHYHAHVYFSDQESKVTALSLRDRLAQLGATLGQIHNTKIGPHPLPMYQVNYSDENKELVEDYLAENTNNISILLHTDSDRVLHDHTDGARWLGSRLALDLEWLQAFDEHLRYRR